MLVFGSNEDDVVDGDDGGVVPETATIRSPIRSAGMSCWAASSYTFSPRLLHISGSQLVEHVGIQIARITPLQSNIGNDGAKRRLERGAAN
jgi:hypothetical protein